MSKNKERFPRTYYHEPLKPKSGDKRFSIQVLDDVSERASNFPQCEDYYNRFDEEIEEDSEGSEFPEISGKISPHESLSLKKVNEIVNQLALDQKDVYFTAHYDEDYLVLEIVHIRELNEQEQLEKYKNDYDQWEKERNLCRGYELQRIEQEIERLQNQTKYMETKADNEGDEKFRQDIKNLRSRLKI